MQRPQTVAYIFPVPAFLFGGPYTLNPNACIWCSLCFGTGFAFSLHLGLVFCILIPTHYNPLYPPCPALDWLQSHGVLPGFCFWFWWFPRTHIRTRNSQVRQRWYTGQLSSREPLTWSYMSMMFLHVYYLAYLLLTNIQKISLQGWCWKLTAASEPACTVKHASYGPPLASVAAQTHHAPHQGSYHPLKAPQLSILLQTWGANLFYELKIGFY